MTTKYTFTIGDNDAGQRLDRFLSKQGFTIGVIMKALRNKDIKVGGERMPADYKLKRGDTVQMYSSNAATSVSSMESIDYRTIPTQLNIVYEDDNVLLLDKPVGLLCHEDDSNNPDTLVNRVKAYLYQKGEFVPENENSFEPALCNRIDRNTGGIVIAAKNAATLRAMNEKIRLRQVKKLYLCILVGAPKRKQATLTAFLEKDAENNTVKITNRKTPSNKTIITRYRVLAQRGELALAEAELLTGRTHQIRAHMAHMGHPLLGDGKYGRNAVNKQHGCEHQALYSYKLAFDFEAPAYVESGRDSEDREHNQNHLDYLNARQFEVEKVWFLEKHFKDAF